MAYWHIVMAAHDADTNERNQRSAHALRRRARDWVAAALAKVRMASPMRMAEAAAMVGSEVACTPDQIFTATGLPSPPSTKLATSSSCAEWTNARIALITMPGAMIGRVMCSTAQTGCAPWMMAARSRLRSALRRLAAVLFQKNGVDRK